ESLLLLIDIDSVAGQYIDVIFRIHHEIFERYGGAPAAPLEHDPARIARSGDTARARDGVENPVLSSRHWDRKTKRRTNRADHTDQRSPLLRQRDDDLGFDRPVLDLVDDIVLDLDIVAAGGFDQSGEGHRDIAVIVDNLVRKRHVIARTHASFEGDEQAAGGRFENRDGDNIADAKDDFRGGTQIREGARKTFRLMRRENVDGLGRQLDQLVGDGLGFSGFDIRR